ncbi:MAG: ImmA/IrrE family metallo-endopeptidase [Rhizomicrobium sp.]
MSNLKRNVEQVRKARGLSEAELSSRVGMRQSELAEFLRSPPKRKEGVIHNLSRELLVPEVLLFAEEVKVRDTRIPDFRLSKPAPGGYARPTLRWIDFAEDIQKTATDLGGADKSLRVSALVDSDAKISDAAKDLRQTLRFTDEVQLGFANARLMFAALRQAVETLNVFVLQLSFPETDGTGFCITGNPYDVVVINTRKQAHVRRSFTLAHELYHCVLGQTGLSDSRVANNAVERRCNSFAAHFLAPADLTRRIARVLISGDRLDIGELRKFAAKLNISMYASLLRLVELGIYKDSAIAAWNRYIERQGDPDIPKGAGGTRVDEWKYKLSKYGFKFASVFGTAKRRDKFDDLEFYKFSGIKPKYQAAYIENASRARAEDADVDEREDDA